MTNKLCEQCHTNEVSQEIRKRHICKDCFTQYVNSKVRKRMESYRFKNLSGDQKKRLLLPLSGGVSSLCLLQILDAQLEEQIAKQNRTAYELLLVHVDLLDVQEEVSAEWYSVLSERFPLHRYLPMMRIYEAFQIDESLAADLSHLDLRRDEEHNDREFYEDIMTSTKSVTTRSDLTTLMMKRLLVATAKQHRCDSILWGHSDSRLAAQALSEVAKGRGGTVPGALADGTSSDGVNSNCVMRDLFKSELELYASILNPPLEVFKGEMEGEPVTSIRNTSIDQLLNSYITSQGEKYPSIMANVVRTASKLQVPQSASDASICPVCRAELEIQSNEIICYGCIRMKQDIRIQHG